MVKAKKDGPLAAALRDRIESAGLTAYRTSKLSGVSVDSILRFLTRERGLTLESADKMADALGISVHLDPDWKGAW